MKRSPTQTSGVPAQGEIWALLLELGRRARAGQPVASPSGLRLDDRGCLETVPADRGWLPHGSDWSLADALPASAHELIELLELYLPLCVGPSAKQFVLGHLGQSLDGQIAAASGASRYVTGPENLRHMHRLRALSDAVVVGASTVAFDDPQLTTRLVSGYSPVRVVVDPLLRVPGARRVFLDGQARTLVLTKSGRKPTQRLPDGVELVSIPMSHGVLSVTAMLAELRKRGLNRLFIEGGGVTVSHFLTARVFTRLHLTVSPVFLGVGKPGVVLPPIQDMHDALRPNVRRFNFGQDVLFDFDFEAEAGPAHTRRAPELAPEENG